LTKFIKCPVCSSIKTERIRSYRNYSKTFEKMFLIKCKLCLVHFSNPMPKENLLKNYNENYHISAHGRKKGVSKIDSVSKAFFEGIAKIRLDYLKNYLKKEKLSKNYKVLEVGPGPGNFLKEMKNNFPDLDYYAIETDLGCHESLINLGVKLISISEIKNLNSYFDFIIISHVIEHLPNPNYFLNKIKFSLKKNGLIFIEVPCKDYLFKSFDEPHLLFFDKKSIKKLTKDFKLVKISYHGKLISEIGSFKDLIFSKLIRRMNSLRIPYYTKENKELKRILKNNFLVNVMFPHQAHIENENPSWWLRVIIKK